MLVFDVPRVTHKSLGIHGSRERAISLMKRVCHLSQSYYTLRKQTVLIIFPQKKNKKQKKKQIRFVCHFKAEGEAFHMTLGETKGRGETERARAWNKFSNTGDKTLDGGLSAHSKHDSHGERVLLPDSQSSANYHFNKMFGFFFFFFFFFFIRIFFFLSFFPHPLNNKGLWREPLCRHLNGARAWVERKTGGFTTLPPTNSTYMFLIVCVFNWFLCSFESSYGAGHTEKNFSS